MIKEAPQFEALTFFIFWVRLADDRKSLAYANDWLRMPGSIDSIFGAPTIDFVAYSFGLWLNL